LAGVADNNVYLRSTIDGRTIDLACEGSDDCFWDIESAWFGRLAGRPFDSAVRNFSPWSPDSQTLVAYQHDISRVFRAPRVHWLKSLEEIELVPLEKAGATRHRTSVFFIDVRSGTRVPIALPDCEGGYLQYVGWRPHTHEAIVIQYSRTLNDVLVLAADRRSGQTRFLLEEHADTTLKNHLDEVISSDHGFYPLPGELGFAWRSSRSGWDHYYHYDWDGRLIGPLTEGEWPAYEIAHVGEEAIFLAAAPNPLRPYDVHICRVDLRTRAFEQLTQPVGVHIAEFQPGGKAFLDKHSAIDRPPRLDLVRCDGKLLATIAEGSIGNLEAVGYLPPEEFSVSSADGNEQLWGVIYKPADFDPGKSYPVIESIYGGPNMIWSCHGFAAHDDHYANFAWALAQLGYMVVTVDGRGTPCRSKSFYDAAHRDWTAGLKDHAAAIRQLCARHSWMDAGRVGVMGFSWGGAYATWALMQYPDVYRAGVAFEPGYDSYQSVNYEPYLGMPQLEPGAYHRANPIEHAASLARPLMIISGTRFTRTTSGSFKMARALIDAGVDHEFVLVPDATHGFVGTEMSYALSKHVAWFERHLKAGVTS
jgi:dipeptidyl aminopeptidase/acylaminoacyl peptidase